MHGALHIKHWALHIRHCKSIYQGHNEQPHYERLSLC